MLPNFRHTPELLGRPYVLWNSRPAKNGQPPPCYGQCNINIGTRKVGAAMKRLPQIHMGPKAKEQILQRWDPVSRTIVNVRCECTNQDVFSDSAPPPLPPPDIYYDPAKLNISSFEASLTPASYTTIIYEIAFTVTLDPSFVGTYTVWSNAVDEYEGAQQTFEDTTIIILADNTQTNITRLISRSDALRSTWIFGQVEFFSSSLNQIFRRRTEPLLYVPENFIRIVDFRFIGRDSEINPGFYTSTFGITLNSLIYKEENTYRILIYNNRGTILGQYNRDHPYVAAYDPPQPLLAGSDTEFNTLTVLEENFYISHYYAVVVDSGVRIYSNVRDFSF